MATRVKEVKHTSMHSTSGHTTERRLLWRGEQATAVSYLCTPNDWVLYTKLRIITAKNSSRFGHSKRLGAAYFATRDNSRLGCTSRELCPTYFSAGRLRVRTRMSTAHVKRFEIRPAPCDSFDWPEGHMHRDHHSAHQLACSYRPSVHFLSSCASFTHRRGAPSRRR
jgi:hypothetical protein